MIEKISSMIQYGAIFSDAPKKAILRKDGYLAVVRKNYRTEGKKPEPINWVLTAYAKESSDTTTAPPDID